MNSSSFFAPLPLFSVRRPALHHSESVLPPFLPFLLPTQPTNLFCCVTPSVPPPFLSPVLSAVRHVRTFTDTIPFYDIKVRQLSADFPLHDLSVRDTTSVNELVEDRRKRNFRALTTTSQQKRTTTTAPSVEPPFKRARAEPVSPSSSRAGQASHCFRCGYKDHVTATCRATTTIAGRAAAMPLPNSKGTILVAPEGGNYCFGYSLRSNCPIANCRNVHRCTICDEGKHGAVRCHHVA